MNIGLNLTYLRPNAVSGSEVYLRELLSRLARIKGNRLTIFCWDFAVPSLQGFDAGIVPVARGAFSQRKRLYAENVRLATVLRAHPVDVLFSPANFAAPLLPAQVPQVATIHDLQHRHFPGHFTRAQRLFRDALFHGTVRRCRALIAVSEYTRQDAMKTYRIASDKITTVPEGVPGGPAPGPDARAAARNKYNLDGAFYYYPATMGWHKNHLFLLDALLELKNSAGRAAALVLSGAHTDLSDDFQRAVRERGLEGQVRHLGFLPREDVLPLLSCASALVYPSLFEGFGLPVLEAMACGVPVICSDAASLPEVAGDAAIVLPPRDPGAWARAMSQVLAADVRAALVERGRRNIRRFSWERCAAGTCEALRRAVEG